MRRPKKINRKKSRKMFTKTARNIHPKNGAGPRVMRGGIRL